MSVFLAISLHPPHFSLRLLQCILGIHDAMPWTFELLIILKVSISTLRYIVQFWPSARIIHRVSIPRMHCDKLSDALKKCDRQKEKY